LTFADKPKTHIPQSGTVCPEQQNVGECSWP